MRRTLALATLAAALAVPVLPATAGEPGGHCVIRLVATGPGTTKGAVAADSVVAGLVERGLVAESGRDEGGAVRYRTTPLFERVFGLESLSELPRLDDLGGDAEAIRARLEAVAARRPA